MSLWTTVLVQVLMPEEPQDEVDARLDRLREIMNKAGIEQKLVLSS